MSQRYVVRIGSSSHEVRLHLPQRSGADPETADRRESGVRVEVDGQTVDVRALLGADGEFIVGGHEAGGEGHGAGHYHVHLEMPASRPGRSSSSMSGRACHKGQSIEWHADNADADALRRALGGSDERSGDTRIVAPMPGRIVQVLVARGQSVTPGQPVVIIEAMKMENELHASCAGTVANVHVESGAAVEASQLLCTIDPAG